MPPRPGKRYRAPLSVTKDRGPPRGMSATPGPVKRSSPEAASRSKLRARSIPSSETTRTPRSVVSFQ